MKFTGQLLVSVIITFVAISTSMAQISPEQAKQSVRSFENDPNLELPEPKEFYNPYPPVARYYYEFELPDDRTYWVDKETGWVIFAHYGHSSVRQGMPISLEQAIQIARNFVQQRSIIFQKYQHTMDVNYEVYFSRYLIEFKERVPENGAYTYNECSVEVAPCGRVIEFSQMWENAPHPNRSRQPAVTYQQAGNRVATYFGFNAWDFIKTPKLLALPGDWSPFNWDTSGLVWYVEVVGDKGREVCGFVDAMTGRLLMADVFLSIPSSFPTVTQPKVCVESVETTKGRKPRRFALKGITPIIQPGIIWLPIEIFKRLGAEVRESKGKIILNVEQQFKGIDNVLIQNRQIYLPANLLKELFPSKVASVRPFRRGWVRIYLRKEEHLKLFKDLLEEIQQQKLRYKAKYRSFLDRREGQLMAKIGFVSIICILTFLCYCKWYKTKRRKKYG